MTTSEINSHAGMSGLDYIQHNLTSGARSPMHDLFGMKLVSAKFGQAVVTVTPAERFYNPMDRVHGGFAATLIDSALGAAAISTLSAGKLCGTVELKISYVRKIDKNTGELSCEANVLHAGQMMMTAEAKVTDANGTLYAHGSGTFLVYPK